MSTHVPPSPRAAALRDALFAADLDVGELAHILDLDETTVRRRLADGTLPGYRLGRQWRMTEEALRRYVAQMKGERPAAPSGPDVVQRGGGGISWGSSSPYPLPSVTHPIGATLTYNAGHDPHESVDIDEP